MPCTGPGPDPTGDRLSDTAALLVFLTLKLKKRPKKAWVKAVSDPYSCDDLTPTLCSLLKKLSSKELTQIVYDARNVNSRRLADWWERHQALDKEREKSEAAFRKADDLRARALTKLTPAEAKALGLVKKGR
jgi:hypothetical protein